MELRDTNYNASFLLSVSKWALVMVDKWFHWISFTHILRSLFPLLDIYDASCFDLERAG